MAFIPANEIKNHQGRDKSHKIGDWVITTQEHEALCGKFTVGSKVQVIEIDPMRGYGIQDEHSIALVCLHIAEDLQNTVLSNLSLRR